MYATYVLPLCILLKTGILHWLSSVYGAIKTHVIWVEMAMGNAQGCLNKLIYCNKQNHVTCVVNKFMKSTFTILAT